MVHGLVLGKHCSGTLKIDFQLLRMLFVLQAFWDEEKEKMSINIKPVQTNIHDVFVAVGILLNFFICLLLLSTKLSLQRVIFNKSKNHFCIHFNAVLTRLVSPIKITLLLKIQWKQHHILYNKIFTNILWWARKSMLEEVGVRGLIKNRLRTDLQKQSRWVESCENLKWYSLKSDWLQIKGYERNWKCFDLTSISGLFSSVVFVLVQKMAESAQRGRPRGIPTGW